MTWEEDLAPEEDDEPTIELDPEWECQCVKDGVEGEWEWDSEGCFWTCISCGETQ